MAFFHNLNKQFHREDPQQLKRESLWLLARVVQYKGKILAVGLLGLIGTLMGLASSVASKYLIDAVTGYRSGLLGRAAIIMVLMMLGSLALHGISSRVSASVHVRVKNAMQHASSIDVSAMEELALEDLSELISQSLLVSIYTH